MAWSKKLLVAALAGGLALVTGCKTTSEKTDETTGATGTTTEQGGMDAGTPDMGGTGGTGMEEPSMGEPERQSPTEEPGTGGAGTEEPGTLGEEEPGTGGAANEEMGTTEEPGSTEHSHEAQPDQR